MAAPSTRRKGGTMGRSSLLIGAALATLTGCATVVHGPYEDVRIESSPPGATVRVSAQESQRGPLYLDDRKLEFTAPAVVQLKRDNMYRVEFQKPGYKLATAKILSSYDWFWVDPFCAGLVCSATNALGETPGIEHPYNPMRFFRAFGEGVRIFSPDAWMGNSFKLKAENAGYFDNFYALDTPTIAATLEPN
jgi:hypothetical protein